MANTKKLNAYKHIIRGWTKSLLTLSDIDLFVSTKWIDKEEGEQIKQLEKGNQKKVDDLLIEMLRKVSSTQ